MKTLNSKELDQVSGGNPLIGLGFGIIGSYAYESMGGKQGIDNYFENSIASAKSSISHWKKRLRQMSR